MGNKDVAFSAQPIDRSGSSSNNSSDASPIERGPKQSQFQTIGGSEHGAAHYVGSNDQLDEYLSTKPIIAFGTTLQASWEALALSFQSALFNGGPSTLVYGSILSGVASASMAATLGEMASILPAVGAQYQWTALLAPSRSNKLFLGYIQGYLTTFAYIAACALNQFVSLARNITSYEYLLTSR